MTEPDENHDELRAAFTRAYGAVGNPNDQGTADRILRTLAHGGPDRRGRRLSLEAASAVATVGVGLAIVLFMVSIPRGAVPAGQTSPGTKVLGASPSPTAAVIRRVTMWSFGYTVGGGSLRFDLGNLPANAKVAVTVIHGGAQDEVTTTADSEGSAHLTTPAPANVVPASLTFNVCVTPVGGTASCFGTLDMPAPVCSPASSPSSFASPAASCTCPPGTRETGGSTRSTNGSYRIGCLGTSRPLFSGP